MGTTSNIHDQSFVLFLVKCSIFSLCSVNIHHSFFIKKKLIKKKQQKIVLAPNYNQLLRHEKSVLHFKCICCPQPSLAPPL